MQNFVSIKINRNSSTDFSELGFYWILTVDFIAHTCGLYLRMCHVSHSLCVIFFFFFYRRILCCVYIWRYFMKDCGLVPVKVCVVIEYMDFLCV